MPRLIWCVVFLLLGGEALAASQPLLQRASRNQVLDSALEKIKAQAKGNASCRAAPAVRNDYRGCVHEDLSDVSADFNQDDKVDWDDLDQWGNDCSVNGGSDADRDQDTDGLDFLT